MDALEAGLYALLTGFIAGYIFHGWEFDPLLTRALAELERLEKLILDRDP